MSASSDSPCSVCAQVVVNGFAASSPGYHFVQKDLSKYTRTCSFDPRGSAQSTWPSGLKSPDFGFKADASDVKLILDTEFKNAKVPEGERTAILAAHSRGWIVSVRFRADYESEYRRVVMASYDGRYCDGKPIESSYEDDLKKTLGMSFPDGTIRYGLAPLMPFLGGMLDLALTAFSGDSFFAGQLASTLHPTLIEGGIVPEAQQAAMVNRYTMSRYWERSAFTRVKWESHYEGDGPTLAQCQAAENAPGDFLWIPAFSICVDVPDGPSVSRYTAQHVSLVQLGPYAQLATTRFRCFLNYTLNGGPSCAGIMKNGEFAHVVTFGESLLCGTPENLV